MLAAAIQADFDWLADLPAAGWDHNSHYHGYLLSRLPARCGAALEIGCGTGAFARLLARRADRVVAVDLSPEMIRVARERSRDCPNIDFRVADVTDWAWPVGQFDCIATIAMLHHLPFAETLARMRDALKPGGVLVALDLFAAALPADFIAGIIAVPVSAAYRLLKNHRLRDPEPVRAAWAAHAPHDHYLTLVEIRRTCAEVLPGAIIHRHLLYRYSLVSR